MAGKPQIPGDFDVGHVSNVPMLDPKPRTRRKRAPRPKFSLEAAEA